MGNYHVRFGGGLMEKCLRITRQQPTLLFKQHRLGRSNGQATIGINILNPCIRSETMSQSNGKKRELAVIAAKIPRGIVVRLDRAASNSWNTRNAVISRVLEQYFTGELVRADNAPLEFSESIGLP